MEIIPRLVELEEKYLQLEKKLLDPSIFQNPEEAKKITKAQAELKEVIDCFKEYKKNLKEIEENTKLVQGEDKELALLAEEELKKLKQKKQELEEKLKNLVLPADPDEQKNVIIEIRAGTGGEEASLFAKELFEMYLKYAQSRGWKLTVLNHHSTDRGGFKEIISQIEGKDVYGWLRFESGVHRVQRVPITESQGRIHTSTVTVAVLPEAEEVEVKIDEEKDLRIDVYRSQGPGGQGVNTTDSAVRITHLPTGIVVTCQDERSQHKNKARALKILKARLLEMEKEKQRAKIDGLRKKQIGTGERAEKIRTYNFPQNRVTDHRINLTLYQLDRVIQGELDPIIESLRSHHKASRLSELESKGNETLNSRNG